MKCVQVIGRIDWRFGYVLLYDTRDPYKLWFSKDAQIYSSL